MIESCLKILSEIEMSGIRVKPDVTKLVSELSALIGIYEKLSSEDRNLVRESLSPRLGMKLVVIGTFAAEKAMSTKDEGLIKIALMSHVLEGVREDYRENIRNLVLVDYAATLIGVNFEALVTEVENFADANTKTFLNNFLINQSGRESVEDYGLEIKEINGELKFSPIA